jgi:hypothetical protein
MSNRRVTLQRLAELSGYSLQTVRRCIIDGDFPFATAKKSRPDARRHMFIINPSACAEYFGITTDELFS